jgi:hypothetical protein
MLKLLFTIIAKKMDYFVTLHQLGRFCDQVGVPLLRDTKSTLKIIQGLLTL